MYQDLEKLLGISITDGNLFELAFTHRSAVNEAKNLQSHNERLEFLGDAVLELAVTNYLFHKYPNLKEGDLTNLRASLVKGETLAEVAKELDFGKFLKVSRGEDIFGGREKASILANTIESVLGAIYIDSGFETAESIVLKHIVPRLDSIIKNGDHIDAKSQFQQVAQSQFKVTPHYKELASSGPDHDKTFEIGAFVGEKQMGSGTGNSKQAGQQAAAKDALKKLGVSWDILETE